MTDMWLGQHELVTQPARDMTDHNPFAGYSLPPLAWLRAFEAAARHKSFTLAAAELNLTQAAVSHQVRSLERHLGVMLFKRMPRSLALTEKGAAYLPPLRTCFDELASATAGLFGPVGKRTLSIRAPISFAALWLAPRLPAFLATWPDISLRMSTVVWAPPLTDDPADIDIRYGDGNWAGMHSTLLASHAAIAVCAPSATRESDDAARLGALVQGHPLIHVTGYDNLWQKLASRHGLTLAPSASLNIDTTISALELASLGVGPAIVLEGLAEPYLADGRLVRVTGDTLEIDESHYLVQPEGQKRMTAEAMLFATWLRQQAGIPPA